jgi:hypothetical protein
MYARLSAVLLACLLAVTHLANAQENTTGSLSGRLVDGQSLAVPGATVTAAGPQGTRTAVTDADGRYNLPFLTPGVYTIRGELTGFKAVERQNVTVSLGQRLELNFTMEVGGLTETVQVTGSAPIIDTSTTTVGAVITSELLTRVPVGRRMTDALYLAPGVSSGGEVGRANPSIGGGSGLENQYVVDGINITNTGYGAIGSYSIIFGSLGSGVTFDFVKEIQVKTAGYEAEFGQSTGGVVNVVTKSGANDINGSLFGYFRPSGTESTWKSINLPNLTQIAAQQTASNVNDVGFEVGGPILRDRLFFFGAYNPQWQTDTFIGLPASPLRALIGETDRERKVNTYSGKLSSQLGSSHRVDASFFGDPAVGEMGPQRTASFRRSDTKGFSAIDYGGHNQNVKYDGIMSANWLLEGSFARAQNEIIETPSVNEWQVTDRLVVPNLVTGGLGFFEANDGTNKQWAAKTTHIFGPHQIRGGWAYEDVTYLQSSNRTGPTIVTHTGERTETGAQVQVLSAPELPTGRMYRVVRANFQAFRTTEQQYTNFFVQDTWRVNNRLTIRPGLRYEKQKLVGNLTEHTWDNNWSPRIGVTYDPTGTGRNKVFVSWGHFYARIPNDLAARALSADAGVTRGDYFDAGLTQPIPNGQLAGGVTSHYGTAGLAAADIDPDSKSTYHNEFLVGFEREAFPGLNLGIRYTHRNFGRILEDIGTAPMVAYLIPPGLSSVEYFITNPGPDTPVTDRPAGFPNISFEKPVHDYDAVEFTADKRFADRWGLQANYRWSRLYGNFEGFFRNDNGQSDPAITSLFDFPTNDPSYVALGRALGFKGDIRFLGDAGLGPLPNDRPHQVKVYGNYAFDMGLNLGLGLFVSSGQPLTALASNPDYQSAGEIPEGPRGSGIQTTDGFRERTPMESSVDFHADYAIRFGGQRVQLIADVFNLFARQGVLNYDNWTETTFLASNPDVGRPWRYQTPRQVRFGLRFAF